jgi:predicted small secreted protein
MTGQKKTVIAALLGLMVLAGCETTAAAVEGVGGVFNGAGQDIRRVSGR